ncbi:MAG: hypothetical protein EOP06_23880 [Proteobacteria bacterium]|nr:MAG: hypothetical protein EOP06_23880 [Pseudomonadota bacterium]
MNAMFLAMDVPEVLELIEAKTLHLQAAADIQTFLNKERGARRPYSSDEKFALVQRCARRSTRHVQRYLASLNPACDFRDSKRYVSKDRLQVTHTLSVEVEEKLERVRSLLYHVNPYMSREELLDQIAEIALDKLDPIRKAERAKKRSQKSALNRAQKSARAIKSLSDADAVISQQNASTILSEQHESSALPKQNAFVVPAQEQQSQIHFIDESVGDCGEIQLACVFEPTSRAKNGKSLSRAGKPANWNNVIQEPVTHYEQSQATGKTPLNSSNIIRGKFPTAQKLLGA